MPKSWEHIQSCAGKYLTICSLKKKIYFQFSSLAQLCPLFATPWTTASQISLSITNTHSLFKLMSIELVMPSNHLILCRSLLLHLQSFPASGSFPTSQFFTSGGQSIGVTASASVPPMNSQELFALGFTSLISLQSKGLWRVFSNTTVFIGVTFSF